MDDRDGFDWLPEQKRALQRQEIKDALIGAVVALLIVSVCLIGG